MSRPILIYGQSGAGKSYSLHTLDPEKTFIIDADKKGALPFEGAAELYTEKNFFPVNSLDTIQKCIVKVGTDEKFAHIENLVIDGISKALTVYEATYNRRNNPKNKFEAYQMLKEKAVDLFDTAKDQRKNLNVIFIGNVQLGDPFQNNSVDRLKVPGNYLKDYEVESDFNYVFYAKIIEDEHVFETFPNKSTAKTPENCFPELVANDLNAVIQTINAYEKRKKVTE